MFLIRFAGHRTHRRIVDAVIVFAVLAVLLAIGRTQEPRALRQQREEQDKARALATSLMGEVLDVQIRQLEENGLTALPVYRDIKEMRESLDSLVSSRMQAITQLLVEATQARDQDRIAKMQSVREEVRAVVAELIAQRQRLYRRTQVARLAEQVREVIALQTDAHDATRSIEQKPVLEREQVAIASLEDQADVQQIYRQLLATLHEVKGWGGTAASGALQGLQVLKAAQVDADLQAAQAYLRDSNFTAAAKRQEAVLKGLTALAERLDSSQGLLAADREAALRLVRELGERQKRLRSELSTANAASQFAHVLEGQAVIHRDLGRLALVLAKFPRTQPLVEQAKSSSFEATTALFEQQSPVAQDAQSKVISSLTQIDELLESLAGLDRNHSAEELAQMIEQMSHLKQQLRDASLQIEASLKPEGDVPAPRLLEEVKQRLQTAAESSVWPGVIAVRLENALSLLAVDGSTPAQWTAAHGALRRAESEVEVQLADLRRRQKAVEVGELARAAEALERTASAERMIGRYLKTAAAESHLPPAHVQVLLAENDDVRSAAARIAAGVVKPAAETSRMLSAIEVELKVVGESLSAQPGALFLPQLLAGSSAAERASKRLTDAAAALRSIQGESAAQLTEIAEEQLLAASAVRESVEQSLAVDEASMEAFAQLAGAREHIAAAIASQARAEGRHKMADALEFSIAVAALSDLQRVAEEAVIDWTSGRTSDPLESAGSLQNLAEQSQKLAAQSPPEWSELLTQLGRAAAETARQSMTGSPTSAANSLKAVRSQAEKIDAMAQQRVDAARQEPATEPKVEAVADARSQLASAMEAASPAAALLDKESPSVLALRDKLREAQKQQANAGALPSELFSQLDEALATVQREQHQRLKETAAAASKLSDRAAPVDASAAAALEQAGRPSQARSGETVPIHAALRLHEKIRQAVGNLAAREQQLRQDQQLAQVLAQLADEQQSARETIAKASETLASRTLSESDRLEAAQSLLRAAQQFAAAQTATGEGAVHISGQEQVANVPIREGLEFASALLRPLPHDPNSQEAGKSDQPVADGQPGQPGEGKGGQPGKELGTKLVPASPQVTAEQIAGQQATQAANQAMTQAANGEQQGQPGEGQGKSESQQQGEASSEGQKGGTAKSQQKGPNERQQPGDPEPSEAAEGDSRAGAQGEDAVVGPAGVEAEPWFSKLPPQVQAAIQAKSRSQAPRAYAERLRRYFESVD